MVSSGPLLVVLEIGLELPPDGVADPPFQPAECFFAGLAFADLAFEVERVRGVVRDLG